jgi:hypothetical protein
VQSVKEGKSIFVTFFLFCQTSDILPETLPKRKTQTVWDLCPNYGLLGYDIIIVWQVVPVFRRNILPPSSGRKLNEIAINHLIRSVARKRASFLFYLAFRLPFASHSVPCESDLSHCFFFQSWTSFLLQGLQFLLGAGIAQSVL